MASIHADHFEPSLPWRPAPPVVPDIAASPYREMAGLLTEKQPGSDAQALKLLRMAFPDFPLSARLAVLAHMPR